MARQDKYSEVDMYLKYVNDPEGQTKLTEALIEKVARWEFADNLMQKHGICKVSINLHKVRWGIETATVYRDFDSAIQVFGSIHSQAKRKQYLRHIHLQKCYKAMEMAEAQKDVGSYLRAMAEFRKNAQFEKEDPEVFDFSKIQPPSFILGHFPELLNNPLPSNWEDQVKALIKTKQKKNLSIDDAQIIDD